MYIERLHVRNVRLLAEQEFSFLNADGTPRLWTVIVGENGVCKSTILQAIALAAMGPKLGSALVPNAQRLRNVNSSEAASIDLTLQPPSPGASFVSALRIEPNRFDVTPGESSCGADRLDGIRARRESGWFVAGYGVGRFLAEPGEATLPKDPVVDRVRGLFNLHHKILGIAFSSAFHLRETKLWSRYWNSLRQVFDAEVSGERLLPGYSRLDLDPDDENRFMAESNRFELRVDGQRLNLPATWLSDGYQAMISWITDLLGHALLEDEDADPRELQGIVLLDEIDLHLHPTWQRRIVPLLRQAFPKLQFIVNTHSPLVLAGFEREEIILLKLRDGQVVQDPAEIEPGVLTASEILTNFFSVQHAGRPDLVGKERRYLELRALKHPREGQRTELRQLEEELDPYWTSGPSDAELRSPQEILKRKA
jgi:hypothetical protein